MRHPVRLRQPAAPLHLIGGKHFSYLQVNATISFGLFGQSKWAVCDSSVWQRKKCSCDLLHSLVPYFVYNVALDMVVEYCRGHLDVSDEDAKGCNRLYVSVCLCLASWLLVRFLPTDQSHKDGAHLPVIPFIARMYLNFVDAFLQRCHFCAALALWCSGNLSKVYPALTQGQLGLAPAPLDPL